MNRSTRRVLSDADIQRLERQLTRNWYTLAAITVVSTTGLSIAIAPLLSEQLASTWPWANTHIVLLVGLVASISLLVWHLHLQRTKITGVRSYINEMSRQARHRARQQSERLVALMNVSRLMGAVTDPLRVFDEITSTCLEIFDCHQASLMLVNQETHLLEIRASAGHVDGNRVMTRQQKIGEGVAGWVAEHQESLVLQSDTDMSKYPDLQLRKPELSASMIVPIMLRDELVGVLNVSSRKSDVQYRDEDLRALELFAENAGACIRHAERAEWMRQLIERQSGDPKASPEATPDTSPDTSPETEPLGTT